VKNSYFALDIIISLHNNDNHNHNHNKLIMFENMVGQFK